MSQVWPWNLTFPIDKTDPSHHVLLTFQFTEYYWQVVGKEQIFEALVYETLSKSHFEFWGTRNCSAHRGNYRKLSLINTKETPDEVTSEDLGHLPFLLFSIHYLCSGQIFFRALTAKLKDELLYRAYCSFAFNKLPVNYIWETVCSAKTYGHLIAKTFTSSLPYT